MGGVSGRARIQFCLAFALAVVAVAELRAQEPSTLGNISTRAFVQTGDNVMIGGFIIQGTEPKRVILRAIGPELSRFEIPNVLANPTLELHDGTGALIASNDNWLHYDNRRDYHQRPGQGHIKKRPRSPRRQGICDHRRAASGQLHGDRAGCKRYHRRCACRSIRFGSASGWKQLAR